MDNSKLKIKKKKIAQTEELEKIIDRYLRNDIPLAFIEEEYELTPKQKSKMWHMVIEYENQMEAMHNNFHQLEIYEFGPDYFEIPHNMPEKGTNDYTKLLSLFKRRKELAEKLNNAKLSDFGKSKTELAKYETEIDHIEEELIKYNIKLVNWCIRRYFRSIPIPKDELQAAGLLHLLRAIREFDPELENQFSTFAVHVIKNGIKREFDELYHISWVNYIQKLKIKELREQLIELEPSKTTISARELSDSGLTPHSSLSIEKYDELPEHIYLMSEIYPEAELTAQQHSKSALPKTFEDYESIDSYEDLTSQVSKVNVEEEAMNSVLKKELETSFEILNEQEKIVIELRFGLNNKNQHTLEEVGNIMGLSKERIRQIEIKALKKLKYCSILTDKNNEYYETVKSRQNLKRKKYEEIFEKILYMESLDLKYSSIYIFLKMSNPDLTEEKFELYYDLLNKAKEIIDENYRTKDLDKICQEITNYKNLFAALEYEDIVITPKFCKKILNYLDIPIQNLK